MSDGEGEKTGISTAVDQELSAADQEILGWSGQQLSLLPSTALAGAGDDDEKRQEAGKRGRGRPPGAANKNTLDWVKYISSRYTNPLIFLAECYNRPAKDLALELQCTPEKAFAFQMAAATKLTEFTNQKMPTTVDLGVDGDLQLVIQTGYKEPGAAPGDSAVDQGVVVIDIPVGESEENPGEDTQDVVSEQD